MMKRNKAYIREIYVVFFLILIICSAIFFLFPVLNEEIIRYERGNILSGEADGDGSNGAGSIADHPELSIKETADSSMIISNSSDKESGLFTPEVGDYIVITILARNISSVNFPKGTVSIRWKYADKSGNDYSVSDVEKFQIFVDGLIHDYHINIGENPRWDSSGKISEIKIELPEVEGVDIDIEKISLKKRVATSVDSHVNRFFRNNFNIREVNRFFIPAYLGFIMLCFFTCSLKLVSKKVITGKMAFSFAAMILVVFSFYYMRNEVFTVKSYFDSYRKNISEGDFKNTYLGFYDFKKFIAWLDENTPENENLIVLVRGEQIYIMSEMAYNLYPKDIKFINISGKSLGDIETDIDIAIRDSEREYSYLVSLSGEDFINRDLSMVDASDPGFEGADIEEKIKTLQKKYVLEKNYREAGGFLYRINN
jgi:hypothetical protein